MRLERVRKGEGIKRLILPLRSWQVGGRVPDIVRTLIYRPKFFGAAYNAWIQAVMRGPSRWSVWERELFASFTSRCNDCVF
ncbi:MAG TPA: hypothetical protein VIJ61_12105 [Thermoanaerobaculia bacterium]|jgi:hypothetical protein